MANPNQMTEPFPDFAAEFNALIEKYQPLFGNEKRVVKGFTITWYEGKALDIDAIRFEPK